MAELFWYSFKQCASGGQTGTAVPGDHCAETESRAILVQRAKTCKRDVLYG